jgi:hypothetical protein
MLGLMQQLSFNSARSGSMTIFDRQGARLVGSNKTCRQGHRQQAKAIVPFGMAQLNNPELTAEVTARSARYRRSEKPEISAKPPAAVPFADHGGRHVPPRPAEDARRPRQGERRLIQLWDMKNPASLPGLWIDADPGRWDRFETPSSVLVGGHDAQRQFAELLGSLPMVRSSADRRPAGSSGTWSPRAGSGATRA